MAARDDNMRQQCSLQGEMAARGGSIRQHREMAVQDGVLRWQSKIQQLRWLCKMVVQDSMGRGQKAMVV